MISSQHPCSDERCALFFTESEDPFVCLHYDKNAEAIDYWGKVARGDLTAEDVIEPYREFLDFDEAETTDLMDHYDEDYNWTGPTVDIEVRIDHEVVETFTAYPPDTGYDPGFDAAKTRAIWFAEGYLAARTED